MGQHTKGSVYTGVPLNPIYRPKGHRNVELSGEAVGGAAMLLHLTALHAHGDAINGNEPALTV